MRPIHYGFRFLSGAAIAIALIAGCDLSSTAAAGGSDDTHTGIVNIQGRVLTRDARPFGNVVVNLRSRNLTDTTDSEGRFQFLSDSAIQPATSHSVVDTVDYLRDGQVIVSLPVPTWTATLPDIMLVQRDLSGSVRGDASRISGASCQLRLPSGTVQRIDLEWNAAQRTFGGFAYFRYQGGIDSFAAIAEVRDDSDRILGRSDSVHFTNRAGNIEFPAFGAANALPVVEIRTFEYSFGCWRYANCSYERQDSIDAGLRQSVRLFAEVRTNLDRFLALEWNVDGEHWLRSSQRPSIKQGPADAPLSAGPVFDTTLTIPGNLGLGSIWPIRARALLTDGTWSEDTLFIHIVRIPPYAGIVLTSNFPMNLFETDIAAGSRPDVYLRDSGVAGARVVSKKLYLVRLKYHDTTSVCRQNLAILDVNSLGKSAPTTTCSPPPPIGTGYLTGDGSGLPVSGNDTTITFPDAPGEYQLRYEVIDSDGDTTLVRSASGIVRSIAPRIDSIVTSADSIRLDWSASPPSAHSLAELSSTRWILIARWIASDRIDSTRTELPDASRSVVLHPPADMVSMKITLRRSSAEIDGFPADTAIASPSPLRLTFSGSILDPARLQGRIIGKGGARATLTGAVGKTLRGEVAHFGWFLEDSTENDAVAAVFPLPAHRTTARLELDVAVPSSNSCRIVLLSSRDKYGTDALGQNPSLGWDVPAGFAGHLSLPLDSTRWQNLTSPPDSSGLDRNAALADIPGVAIIVESRLDAPLAAGHVELDNITWK